MLGSGAPGEISRWRASPGWEPARWPPRRRWAGHAGGGPGRATRSCARRCASSTGAASARLGRRRIGLGLLLGLGVLDGLLVLVRLEEVGGVEEGALLLTDVDEGRLDAGQHRLDPSEVDVADRAAMVGTVDQQLDQPVVFQDRHAGFPLAPVDQDLALQVMTSATAGAP